MLRSLAVATGLILAALAPAAASAATMSTYPSTVDSRGTFLYTGTGLTPGQFAQFAYGGTGTCAASPGPGYEIPPNGTVTIEIEPEPVWASIRCLGTSTITLGQGAEGTNEYAPLATAPLNIVKGTGIRITPFVSVTQTPVLLTGLQPLIGGKLPAAQESEWEILGLDKKKEYLLSYKQTSGKASKGCAASFEDVAGQKPDQTTGIYTTYTYTARPGKHWCKNSTYTVTLLHRTGYTGGKKVTSTKVKIGA
jgi:hypothetical protein